MVLHGRQPPSALRRDKLYGVQRLWMRKGWMCAGNSSCRSYPLDLLAILSLIIRGLCQCGPSRDQQWILTPPGVPPPSSTSTTAPPPAATGVELHWAGPSGIKCLGLTIRAASDGTIVAMYAPLLFTHTQKELTLIRRLQGDDVSQQTIHSKTPSYGPSQPKTAPAPSDSDKVTSAWMPDLRLL